MKTRFLYIPIVLGVIVLLFASCDSEDDLVEEWIELNETIEVIGSSGNADFTNHVSFGASFMAGFMDNALYTDGQNNGLGNFIAQQLQTTGIDAGNYNQPDINSVLGFSGTDGTTIFGRFFLNLETEAPQATVGGDLPTAFSGDKSLLNNFAVPGIQLGQVLTPLTGGPDSDMNPAFNALYQRFATDPGVSTILSDALATNPTFFTSSLGGNDLLGYAVTGGSGAVPITDAATFEMQYTSLVNALVGSGAKGVLMNIPPLHFLPFFQAVPWNAIAFDTDDPEDAANVAALNSLEAYGGFNAALDGLAAAEAISQADADARKVVFANGTNGVAMIDDGLTDISTLLSSINPALAGFGQLRQSNSTDLILLTSAGSLLTGTGTQIPAGDSDLLTLEEQTEIITGAAAISNVIEGIVTSTNAAQGETVLGLVDIYPIITDGFGLTSEQATLIGSTQAGIDNADGELGIVVNGINLSPDFTPNGFFSADGIHPNPRGYAIMANYFIEAINTTFGAEIPSVDVLSKRGVLFE